MKLGIVAISAFFAVVTNTRAQGPDPVCISGNICKDVVKDAFRRFPSYRDLNTEGLIKRQGYPVEKHKITTEDGYILTLYRIPYTNTSAPSPAKVPVLLGHGIISSSAQWTWQPPKRNLMFMLADAGFDVWVANFRGNSYGREHLWLNPDDRNNLTFWDFSFHEMGKYDLYAMFKYILNETRHEDLYYIGHSQGTTAFFAGMMVRPEMNAWVRLAIMMAPVAYAGFTYNPVIRLQVPIYAPYESYLVINELFGGFQSDLGNLTQDVHCDLLIQSCGLCFWGFGALLGFDPCQMDFTTLPGVVAHLPDTISVKVGSHQSQSMLYGTFSEYNYGFVLNLKKYGSPFPPAYNWNNYDVPTVLYYGDNDNIADPIDVLRTASSIKAERLMQLKRVDFKLFNHMDFILGKDADYYLYFDILDILTSQRFG